MQTALIRLIVLVVVLLNQILVVFGYNPLPWSEDQIFEGVSSVVLVVVAIWTWYRNNPTSKEGEKGTKYMHELKDRKKKIKQ